METPPRPTTGPSSLPTAALLWDEFYRNASPDQQRELLSLAGRQGILYAHQLPASSNGSTDKGRPFLTRLLAGQIANLPPLRTTAIQPHDGALDDIQREAVARAMQTPDVCLIQGLPGTGKSRVVAEIVNQAASRGDRILLVAPNAAALDRVLELTAGRDVLCPIRCLASGERLEFLTPTSRAATLAERGRRLTEHTLPGARGEVAHLEKRCLAHGSEEAAWERMRELVDQHEKLQGEREALNQARATLAEQLTALATDPAAFGSVFAAQAGAADEARLRFDKTQADLTAQIETQRKEKETAEKELESLRPLADAKDHKRWWTGNFWKATMRGDLQARITDLAAKAQNAQDALANLERQLEPLQQHRQEELHQWEAERKRLIETETQQRQTQLDKQQVDIEARSAAWQTRWDAACAELSPSSPRPADTTAEAVAAAREAWHGHSRQNTERLAFARQWAACLEQVAEHFPSRLIGLCNLVVATVAGLPSDPHFGDAASTPLFDLVILEGADQITDIELQSVARRGRRWVLVGHPPLPEVEEPAPSRQPEPSRSSGPRSRGAPFRRPSSNSSRPIPFFKMWQQLHCDPRQLPSVWVQDKTGLCCRMRSVTAEESQHLESEHLSDRPDIELRILALPRCEPALAEIVFPPSMTIAQAKEYVFKELEHLPVAAPGGGLRWLDHEDRVVLRLADVERCDALPVQLAPGVREKVFVHQSGDNAESATTWATCCVEFERAAGWHREQAEQWVERHLGLRDAGRTVKLDAPYRMRPELAALLSGWLFAGGYRQHQPSTLNGPAAVEFVAVPAQRDNGRSMERSGSRSAGGRGTTSTMARSQAAAPPRRGGAGLEVDLSDPRSRERLPGELVAGLPERGFANLAEAEAVVRAVEALVVDPVSRASVLPSVGVIGLYPGQVELIRRLMQLSPTVASSGVEVKVDLPAGFREQECSFVLVSLTRSHTHRAVSFGEGPQALLLALTRARTRLLLFGDSGTLARRSQWETAVDHLDETASARERAVVSGLVDYLHGQGPLGQTFHLREGSGA